MSDTLGGEGPASSGPSGADSSPSYSNPSTDPPGLSSSSGSSHASPGQSVDPTVSTTVTTAPPAAETTIETEAPQTVMPEARWEDSRHPQPTQDFNKVANERAAETTVHKKTEQGSVQSTSHERPKDDFWKDPNIKVPPQDPKQGMVSMKELAMREKQRAELTPRLDYTIGGTVEQAANQQTHEENEKRIGYLKGRLKGAHETVKKDFERSR